MVVASYFSLLRHDIYIYNFSSSLSINVRKYTHQTRSSPTVLIYIMIFVFRELFLTHNNLVTQKISYFEIFISLANDAHFYIRRRMCVNFLKYLTFLVQNSFSSILVENDRNLIVAKMFRTMQLPLKKRSSETYISICCVKGSLYTTIFSKYTELLRLKNIFRIS